MSEEQTQTEQAPSSPEPVAPSAPAPTKSFDQDAVNVMVGTARKEGREVAMKDLLAELEVPSKDDLQSLVTDHRARKEAALSDMEKLQQQLDQSQTTGQQLASQVSVLEAQSLQSKLEHAALKAIHDAGANQPPDVLVLLKDNEKWSGLLSDDGAIDTSAVQAAVAAFKEERPHYFVLAPGKPIPPNLNATDGARQVSNASSEDAAKRKYFEDQGWETWEVDKYAFGDKNARKKE